VNGNSITPTKSETREERVQVFIMLAIAGMAGAASFTHVHDWTMANSPNNTPDWIGWANAVVSELVPLAAGLEARRRRRLTGHPGRYPIVLICAGVALSLAGQFGSAKPSISGWLLSAVPALGFLAMVKLVLGRPVTRPAPADTEPVATAVPAVTSPDPVPARPPATVPVELSNDLLMGARLAALSHQQTTGHPITAAVLADQFGLTPDAATRLLAAIGEATPVPSLNGRSRAGAAS